MKFLIYVKLISLPLKLITKPLVATKSRKVAATVYSAQQISRENARFSINPFDMSKMQENLCITFKIVTPVLFHHFQMFVCYTSSFYSRCFKWFECSNVWLISQIILIHPHELSCCQTWEKYLLANATDGSSIKRMEMK